MGLLRLVVFALALTFPLFTSSYSDIFGDKPTSLLSAPSMAGLQVGDPLLMPSSANSPAADSSSDEDHYPPSDSRHPSGSRRPSDSWRGAGSASVSASHSRALSRPRNLVQEELATTAELRGIKSYSYTYGYGKLIAAPASIVRR